MTAPKRAKKFTHPKNVLVDEIVAHVTAYRHHPKFRRAVVEAKSRDINCPGKFKTSVNRSNNTIMINKTIINCKSDRT